MRRGRITTWGAAALAALTLAPAAFAGDTSISEDLRDGTLDGTYSQKQLEDYLRSAMTQGYGNPVTTPPPAEAGEGGGPTAGVAGVRTPPAQSQAGASQPSSPLAETRRVGSLPFTGLDLALVAGGGVLLIGLGLAARRAGRSQLI